jgi:hypothetical protein
MAGTSCPQEFYRSCQCCKPDDNQPQVHSQFQQLLRVTFSGYITTSVLAHNGCTQEEPSSIRNYQLFYELAWVSSVLFLNQDGRAACTQAIFFDVARAWGLIPPLAMTLKKNIAGIMNGTHSTLEAFQTAACQAIGAEDLNKPPYVTSKSRSCLSQAPCATHLT